MPKRWLVTEIMQYLKEGAEETYRNLWQTTIKLYILIYNFFYQ